MSLSYSCVKISLVSTSLRVPTFFKFHFRTRLTANAYTHHIDSRDHGRYFQRRTMSSLAKFVTEQKEKYLQAVADGEGKDWTVVMGNEAGGWAIWHHYYCHTH